MKGGIKIGDAMIYDIEALFSRLLIVGQNRNTSLVSVFEYEFCAVPSSIIGEFGFMRKGNKANIVKKLAIISTEPCPPDEVIVDGGQLLYHIVWPCGDTISTVATSMATILKNHSVIPTKIIFDRYGNVSAKDHERSRRAGGAVPAEYNLTLTSPLPNRDIIMKSKAKKRLISRLLCTCTMDSHILMVGEDEGLLNHDEADVLMISYMRPWERARRSYVSSVAIQTFLFFWFSGLGSLWSLICFLWKSRMGVCCMLTTLQQLWAIKVFNSSECIQSQDVTLCLTLSKRESS